jgi:hypothetical protein
MKMSDKAADSASPDSRQHGHRAKCCFNCGMSSSTPLRQHKATKDYACNSCFERMRFFSTEAYDLWKIIDDPPLP